jgi:rubrerythrin
MTITDQRPSCKEIVERIEGIIRGVCPEIARYDASAETDFQARRSAEAARRQQREQRPDSTKQEKYAPHDTHMTHTHTTHTRDTTAYVCRVCGLECEQCRWSAFGR